MRNVVSNPTQTIDYNKHVNALAARDWKKHEEEWKVLRDGGRATLSAMKQAFTHGDWRVRRECAAYMDHHADNTCVPVLLKALKDPNQKVRRNAIHSLSCDRCKPAPLISDVIPRDSEERPVIPNAGYAIFGTATALPLLQTSGKCSPSSIDPSLTLANLSIG